MAVEQGCHEAVEVTVLEHMLAYERGVEVLQCDWQVTGQVGIGAQWEECSHCQGDPRQPLAEIVKYHETATTNPLRECQWYGILVGIRLVR